VVKQLVGHTDGVPLFIEELTRALLDTGLRHGESALPEWRGIPHAAAIPVTLQDALMARLDQVGEAKRTAQVGAVIGRQFRYALIRAVSPLEEATVQRDLRRLVASELLYQRGVGTEATYLFKHALIQDAAYQSLLRRSRQQYHRRIAEVLEGQFGDTAATQPELLARHYTAAGLNEAAIPYWRRAGQLAMERSANVEAIAHLRQGLAVLETLPATPRRAQAELDLQLALGVPLLATQGWAAAEVEHAYAGALALCQQMEESARLFPALLGLSVFYFMRAEMQRARELGEQCLGLARRAQDPELHLEAVGILGPILFFIGECIPAHTLLEQGIAIYDPKRHRGHALQYGHDPGVICLLLAALALWAQGYPDRALTRCHEAHALGQEVAHAHSLAFALVVTAWLHLLRREAPAALEWAEAGLTFAREQGLPHLVAESTIIRGWALGMQGQSAAGMALISQGLEAYRATGAEMGRPWFLSILAQTCGNAERAEEGLTLLTAGLELAAKTGERWWEAELYRLQGELLRRATGNGQRADTTPEACFLQALAVARRQQAKTLELRAATSLARLWQSQGKRKDTYALLAPVYEWFTEGFDTADLKDANALLEDLRS
jgi:predicted ATPase